MTVGTDTNDVARLRWFLGLFGLAALFHLVNVGAAYRGARASAASITLVWLLLVLATALAWWPKHPSSAVALCIVIPITAWRDAPVIGNHWVVMTLVSMAVLGAVSAVAISDRRPDLVSVSGVVVPISRGIFFAFYGFSALSKVNRAFLDPTVGCGNYFTDETARSLGWHLGTANGGSAARFVPIAVIFIECSVVVLLARRPTRMAGIVLALAFHGFIAWDGYHSFNDFSCLVYALLVLFLPTDFFTWWSNISTRRARIARMARLSRSIVVVAAASSIVIQLATRGKSWRRFDRDFQNAQWRVISVVASAIVVAYFVSARRRRADMTTDGRLLRPSRAKWLLVFPALAVLNGVSVYAGVKTSYSWNMYSNLVTLPGRANSYLVPSGTPFTSQSSDLAHIVSSKDPSLQRYADQDYSLPVVTLRAYTSSHPDTSVTYIRRGVRYDVAHTRSDPVLSKAVPEWSRRLFAYRSVDNESPARCQPFFLPAN
jgi:hypothetical protein